MKRSRRTGGVGGKDTTKSTNVTSSSDLVLPTYAPPRLWERVRRRCDDDKALAFRFNAPAPEEAIEHERRRAFARKWEEKNISDFDTGGSGPERGTRGGATKYLKAVSV